MLVHKIAICLTEFFYSCQLRGDRRIISGTKSSTSNLKTQFKLQTTLQTLKVNFKIQNSKLNFQLQNFNSNF